MNKSIPFSVSNSTTAKMGRYSYINKNISKTYSQITA